MNDETREALASDDYVEAFDMAMTGRTDEWTDAHRAAVRRARELAKVEAPGMPMPQRSDPQWR